MNRITSAMTATATQTNLQESSRALARLQERAATREAITRPSDDPAGTRTVLAARAELVRAGQYERNLQNADLWLGAVDSALQSGLDIMTRAQDLALRGANGTLNQAGRNATATEIEQLGSELLALANTQVLGRSVFAGTSAEGSAYAGTPATWQGVAGATVQRRISDTETVRVDVSGPEAFGEGATSAFEVLAGLATSLRAGGDLAGSLAAAEDARRHMSDALTAAGARHATVGRAMTATQTRMSELEASRASVEEIDLARAAMELRMKQVDYEAALAVSAQAIQTSLLDYLR